jgi:hypothetical protein
VSTIAFNRSAYRLPIKTRPLPAVAACRQIGRDMPEVSLGRARYESGDAVSAVERLAGGDVAFSLADIAQLVHDGSSSSRRSGKSRAPVEGSALASWIASSVELSNCGTSTTSSAVAICTISWRASSASRSRC